MPQLKVVLMTRFNALSRTQCWDTILDNRKTSKPECTLLGMMIRNFLANLPYCVGSSVVNRATSGLARCFRFHNLDTHAQID